MHEISKDTRVGSHQGVQLWLDHSYMKFVAEPEEGQTITADSHQGLKDKIDSLRARKKQEAKARSKKTPIPVIKRSDRGQRWGELIRSQIVGLHDGTGHPIIKVGAARAVQEGYSHRYYYKDMTDDQIAEYDRLRKAAKDAEKAVEVHMKKFKFEVGLAEFAKKTWCYEEDE